MRERTAMGEFELSDDIEPVVPNLLLGKRQITATEQIKKACLSSSCMTQSKQVCENFGLTQLERHIPKGSGKLF
jgi:hypothetical protein